MAGVRLTPNAVAAALAGDTNLKPVVQVVDLRSIAVNGPLRKGPRFRAIISDGVATTPALFAAQLCDLARSGLVRRGAIVQLIEYIINTVQKDRRYLSPPPPPASPLTRSLHWIACALVGFGLGFTAARRTKAGRDFSWLDLVVAVSSI